MTSEPLVSILINNHNYAEFLGEAIDSALAQTYGTFEVVVVDDGSTDSSREVISRYGSRILCVIKANGGQASAYNAGFAASKGDIICLLDSDDLLLPTKLSHIVEIFGRDLEIGWCFDVPHEFNHSTGERHPQTVSVSYGKWDARAMSALGKQPLVWTASSGMSFRRETLNRILPMPEEIRITSDNYIKHVAAGLAEGWMTPNVLTLQRIHGNNAYTRRVIGKDRIAGRTLVLTGALMHDRFPVMRRVGKKLVGRGLGKLWATGGIDPDCKPFLSSYIRTLAFPTKSEVFLRAAYWMSRDFYRNATGR